ncbi:tRNA (adenine(22)-N(1))-methyltransferase TrmK [Deinococcus sp.]|uniref:tRNA (adenine(22)-N(1))-methyltransferase n=1 Tax=Deinococcus sp. TaxID=47478 RepID=UPI0025D576FE|nr:tRNA (adenine(22)-N(1))-methyltransferase TrmK [Deinococcus sp.]
MTAPLKLDARLHAVLSLTEAEVHADIGTDHAALPLALIQSGRCERVIAVELKGGPLALARRAVAASGLANRIEVRQGDGFGPILPGEVGSASLCGLGARTILSILERAAWLPPMLILQPNAEPEVLRGWAQAKGFHLNAETLAEGFWRYPILKFEQRDGLDPAYLNLPHAAALRFGPHLLRRRDAGLLAELERQHGRLSHLYSTGGERVQADLQTVRDALSWLQTIS